MNIELYNSIFNTNYTSSTAKNFIPHEAYLEASDEYEDISFSKMVKIVGIGSTKASRLEVSSEMFKEIKETMIARYGIYFDGDDLSTIVDYCMNNEYSAISIEMSAIQTMIKAVSIFENFFTLIVVILLVGCAFIVIGFGIKNIKSRMYEIGVLKALGCNSLVEPDVFCRPFLRGDIILMCSDGLTNMLKDDEIYKILLENPEKPVANLINEANRQGGLDNITAIIIDNV
jgi:hypothetical protein